MVKGDGSKSKRYSTEEKADVLRRYFAKEPIDVICSDTGIDRATVYRWAEKAKKKCDKSQSSATKKTHAHARDKGEECDKSQSSATSRNYFDVFKTEADYEKAALERAMINGICLGLNKISISLDEAEGLEGTDRIYARIACVKELRQSAKSLLDALTEVSVSGSIDVGSMIHDAIHSIPGMERSEE